GRRLFVLEPHLGLRPAVVRRVGGVEEHRVGVALHFPTLGTVALVVGSRRAGAVGPFRGFFRGGSFFWSGSLRGGSLDERVGRSRRLFVEVGVDRRLFGHRLRFDRRLFGRGCLGGCLGSRGFDRSRLGSGFRRFFGGGRCRLIGLGL